MNPSRRAFVLRGLAAIGMGLAMVAFHSWVSFERAGSVEIRGFPSSVFRMDVFRAPRDWATPLPSGRTSVHPLAKLVLTPVGLAVRRHVPFAGRPVDAARLLAIAGVALGVLLAGLLAAQLAGDPLAGLGAALLTGVSFSSVLLAAIPESASLACVATLAPLVFLGTRTDRPWTWPESVAWLLLGLLGIALTVTQLVHWGIALLCRMHALRSRPDAPAPGRVLGRVTTLLALVVGLAAAGSWLQAERYPGSRKFYELAAVASDESAFLRLEELRREPLRHVARVGAHFLGVNFVSPFPERSGALMREIDVSYWILSVEEPWRAEWTAAQGALAAALALALAFGVWALARAGARSGAFAAPLLSIAAMFVLHLAYGHEYLLYAGHWHGAVVAVLVAGVWRAWPHARRFAAIAILALSCGLAINSVAVMDRVYAELEYGLEKGRRDAEGRPLIPLGSQQPAASLRERP